MAAQKANRSLYTKHKSQPDFDPAKFTPPIIANKKQLNIDCLIAYFLDNHPMPDCATKFGCSKVTIKRRLVAAGIDTSIYNHSQIAKDRNPPRKCQLSDAEITELYQNQNLDSKTIADESGVHYNTIRKRIRRMQLKKDRKNVAKSMSNRHLRNHGTRHPAQRPDVLAKTRKSAIRSRYTANSTTFEFRSLHELAYALLLDQRGLEWYYEEMIVPYVDMLTGKHRIYIIDFTVITPTGVEWVEVKPAGKMIPQDKFIYATRRAEETGIQYRGLTTDERQQALRLLASGYRSDQIEYLRPKPRSDAIQVSYNFSDRDTARKFTMVGWTRKLTKRWGPTLYTTVLRRND